MVTFVTLYRIFIFLACLMWIELLKLISTASDWTKKLAKEKHKLIEESQASYLHYPIIPFDRISLNCIEKGTDGLHQTALQVPNDSN